MKFSKYILLCLNILLLVSGVCIVSNEVNDDTVKFFLILCILCLGLVNLGSYFYFRKQFTDFSDEMCHHAEEILHGNSMKRLHNQETLTSKMVMELEKVEDIYSFQLSESKKDKKELQEMISELTHQIKTPASNIQMYCEMFSDADISSSDAKRFVEIIRQQLKKLEFLLDILVKSSRLETDMINLEMEDGKIVETLAIAVNSVIQKAEHKNIDISIMCRPSIQVSHDTKWTAEAIENILDNAIKYFIYSVNRGWNSGKLRCIPKYEFI
ncbi:MAG: HAMP domain-containing sensor histidine kinase [Lachnospiraceae bacterium]|nr:HAMP domain-containing sensor histidine kinase [Lachnospiraceae bacterium]